MFIERHFIDLQHYMAASTLLSNYTITGSLAPRRQGLPRYLFQLFGQTSFYSVGLQSYREC